MEQVGSNHRLHSVQSSLTLHVKTEVRGEDLPTSEDLDVGMGMSRSWRRTHPNAQFVTSKTSTDPKPSNLESLLHL